MLLVALEHKREIGVALLPLRGRAEMTATGILFRCDLVERCTAPMVSMYNYEQLKELCHEIQPNYEITK